HCLYFFFQAEDGIRDATVTGVQTCALPILKGTFSEPTGEPSFSTKSVLCPLFYKPNFCAFWKLAPFAVLGAPENYMSIYVSSRRSEERRVGKECICLGGG